MLLAISLEGKMVVRIRKEHPLNFFVKNLFV